MNETLDNEQVWSEKLLAWADEYKIDDLIGKSEEELLSLETLKINFTESPKRDGFITPEIVYLQNLKDLTLERILGLKEIPLEITRLKKLQSLKLIGLSIIRVPEEIGQLTNLKEFVIASAFKVKSLPFSIIELPNLETLIIESCLRLETLPISQKPHHNLKKLVISFFNRLIILEFLKQFPELEELGLCRVPLWDFPLSVCKLKHLKDLTMRSTRIKQLPTEIANLQNLEILICNSLTEIPEEVCHLPKLKEFDYGKEKLDRLPVSIDKLLARGYIKIAHSRRVYTVETLLNKELLKEGFEIISAYDKYLEEAHHMEIITYRFKQESLVKYIPFEEFEQEYQTDDAVIKQVAKKALGYTEAKEESDDVKEN